MATKQARDKYYLRSLHEEIGLYDRKLAHLLKYDTFASDTDRDLAAGKLSTKRDLLVRNARQLIEVGIEYKTSELPLSLRTIEQLTDESAMKVRDQPIVTTATEPQKRTPESSCEDVPYFLKEIEQYMEKRRLARAGSPATRKSH